MIATIDVGYGNETARAACVTCDDWSDSVPRDEIVLDIDHVEPYVPGHFYRRELPCAMAVLSALATRPQVVVVDGYVWLDPDGRKGLGAYLFDALGGVVPVIGVAKTHFRTATDAVEVLRGSSKRPLYITAVGLTDAMAASAVLRMHGKHRIPTLLKRVDELSRTVGV